MDNMETNGPDFGAAERTRLATLAITHIEQWDSPALHALAQEATTLRAENARLTRDILAAIALHDPNREEGTV